MKSTGEVMGLDRDFDVAFAKSQLGGGTRHAASSGTVFVSVRDADKPRILQAVTLAGRLGFKVIATSGTQRYLAGKRRARRRRSTRWPEGRPHIVDAIKNGDVQLVFNTTEGATALADSAARCGARPSCIKCRTTPLFPVPSLRRRASRPISGATSRYERCRAISAAGPEPLEPAAADDGWR